jgi:hypothetical protein
MIAITAVTAAVVSAPVMLRAQARPALQTVKTVSCTFTQMAVVDWGRDGTPMVKLQPAMLKLGYSDVNTDDGSADVVGTTAASGNTAELPIVVRYVTGYLHFMQVGYQGNLYTTTLFDQPIRPGVMKAVHSRHVWESVALPGYSSRPETYYGQCEIAQ